jgi:transcriptional antiterminator RfaH
MSDWPRWACVHTEPRQEVKAKWGIDALGCRSFLPMRKIRSHKRGEGLVLRPLFQGYAFAEVWSDWGPINSIDGVRRVICHDGVPVRVPDGVIEELRRDCGMGLFDEHTPKSLSVGDRVRLIDGPFRDHIAMIIAMRRNSVSILWTFLGSTRRVEVALAFVEAA